MAKTTYVWDELSDNVIEEYEDGVLSASYTHEPGLYGNLLSQNRNGVTSYFHYDGRGDTVALTDDSGNVTDTKEYDAWGNVIASTGSTVTPFQFGGRQGYQRGLSNGVSYIRGRIYQSTLARLISSPAVFVNPYFRVRQMSHPFRIIAARPSSIANLQTLGRITSSYAVSTLLMVWDEVDDGYYAVELDATPEVPTLAPCGGFAQRFKWKLPDAAKKKLSEKGMKGYIVQQVLPSSNVTDCDGNELIYPYKNSAGATLNQPPGPSDVFWEAWTVDLNPDSNEIEIKPEQSQKGIIFNDYNFSPNFGPGTKGVAGYDFEMILFIGPGATVPPIFKPDPNHPAGNVPHTTEKPNGWELAPLRTLRSIHVSWNCCPCDPEAHKTKLTKINNGKTQNRNKEGEIVE